MYIITSNMLVKSVSTIGAISQSEAVIHNNPAKQRIENRTCPAQEKSLIFQPEAGDELSVPSELSHRWCTSLYIKNSKLIRQELQPKEK